MNNINIGNNRFFSAAKNVLFNLKRLLNIAWETDRNLTVGYYGSAGLSAFFPIITAYIYKLLIDSIVTNQGIKPTIPFIIIAILGSRYFINLCWDFVSWILKETYFDYLLRYKMQNKLNSLFCEKLHSIDIQHLEDPKVQDLITKAKDTLTWRPPDFLRAFSYLFTSLVSYISSFILLGRYGWYLPFVISFFGIPRLYLRARQGALQWSIWGSGAPEVRKLWYLQWLLTQKESIVESRIFQSGKALLERYKKIQEDLFERNKKPVRNYMRIASFPQLFEMSALFTFAYLRLPLVLSGQMTIGDFSFFIDMLSRVAEAVSGMVQNLGWMYENNLYVNHFFDVLGLKRVVKESDSPITVPNNPNPPVIEFRDVSFSYPGTKKRVLKNLSFKVESGQNVAIVGKNGAGKTTIVKLLCRFYDVGSGEILINNINIKDIDLSSWYKKLGTLFQDFVHYDFTVRENITLGDTSVSNETRLKEAAEKSGSIEFIEKLKNKFDQQLGKQFETGVDLSHGQWQKIAIARAFYEGSPVLILDEPTSAIDAESEYKIFNNLHTSYKDKSLLFISHRFSTVKSADKIIVLGGGKIVEEGTHQCLMKKEGKYSKLFKLQAEAYQ